MWPPPYFLRHPRFGWTVDLSAMNLDAETLAALPWAGVFAEMEALEQGAIANADEGRQVGHYWLRDPLIAPTMGQAADIGDTVKDIQSFVSGIHDGSIAAEDGSAFTDVLHVGIGGSALGPALVVDALGDDGLAVHFLDNTDPDGIARVISRLGDRLRTTLVVVVSKSGGTPEPRNALALVREACVDVGLETAGRLVAITGPDSKLNRLAKDEGWLARFPIWDWVGGRTSVTAAVGLLPAALAGVDIEAFLTGAKEMDAWTRHQNWEDNPAALLAGAWHLAGNGRGDRAMVVLPYADRLLLLSRYLQQLVMESLGKRLDRQGNVVEQGIAVYGNKGSTDQHAFVQQLRDGRDDFFVTFLQVLEDGDGSNLEVAERVNAGDFLQGFLLGTRQALSEGERPSITLTIPRIEATSLGALIALYERAVGFYATLIDINAYHQPGVEAGKKAAAEMLDLSRRVREILEDRPRTVVDIAEALGSDPVTAYYICDRLAFTGRLRRVPNEIPAWIAS